MYEKMTPEVAGLRKSSVTFDANMRLFTSVNGHVALNVRGSSESLVTLGARILFVAMGEDVSLKDAQMYESLGTLGTGVDLLLKKSICLVHGVSQHVLLKTTWSGECLLTL
jgi:hypothetical protein